MVEGFMQSDQILIDGDEVWFVDRNENALYKAVLATGECELVSLLPGLKVIQEKTTSFYRVTPHCYKVKDLIFCLPDRGNKIFVYNQKQKNIDEITIENPNNVRLSIHDFWGIGNRLWVVSYGLCKILEINTDEKTIEGYYDIFDNPDDLPGYEAKIGEHLLFCISRNSNWLCEFDVRTRTKKVWEIPGLEEGIYTICSVGACFWFAGISGKIYLWDKKHKVKELENYPMEITVCGDAASKSKEENLFLKSKIPVFYRSFLVGDTICFLPFNHDQALCDVLLCVNKKNCHMWAVKLLEGKRNCRGIYTLEYISSENKIGILFSGNNYISEIDIYENTVRKRYLQKNDWEISLYRSIEMNTIIYETEEKTLKAYEKAIWKFQEVRTGKNLDLNCGKRIWNTISIF